MKRIGVETEQIGYSKKKADRRNPMCFCEIQHGEIIVKDAGKIHGGAYVHSGARYLQQGNILVSSVQEEMLNYVKAQKLDQCPPISVNDTVDHVISRETVVDAIIYEFGKVFDIEISDLTLKEHTFATQIAHKYVVS